MTDLVETLRGIANDSTYCNGRMCCAEYWMGEAAAEIECLRGALKTCQKAIESAPEDAFGYGAFTDVMGDACEYPLRLELLDEIQSALSPHEESIKIFREKYHEALAATKGEK